eukprot:Rhum_TRINITY_DN15452_c6_g7::Rhum_TRINITY_DN15452_c6_g7_i1::g.157703::m.157703
MQSAQTAASGCLCRANMGGRKGRNKPREGGREEVARVHEIYLKRCLSLPRHAEATKEVRPRTADAVVNSAKAVSVASSVRGRADAGGGRTPRCVHGRKRACLPRGVLQCRLTSPACAPLRRHVVVTVSAPPALLKWLRVWLGENGRCKVRRGDPARRGATRHVAVVQSRLGGIAGVDVPVLPRVAPQPREVHPAVTTALLKGNVLQRLGDRPDRGWCVLRRWGDQRVQRFRRRNGRRRRRLSLRRRRWKNGVVHPALLFAERFLARLRFTPVLPEQPHACPQQKRHRHREPRHRVPHDELVVRLPLLRHHTRSFVVRHTVVLEQVLVVQLHLLRRVVRVRHPLVPERLPV